MDVNGFQVNQRTAKEEEVMKYSRLICLGMAAALTCTSVPQEAVYAQPATGQEALPAGERIERAGLAYEELEDGTLSVKAAEGAVLKELEIPAEVDGKAVSVIALQGFAGCKDLEKVTIPESVKEIRAQAFMDCTGITELVLPTGLTLIGADAFKGCTGLTQIELPENVRFEWEEMNAFAGCSNLEQITVASGNKRYLSENGILYRKDLEDRKAILICYPAGKKDARFEVPGTVNALAQASFQGSQAIQEVVFQADSGVVSLGVDTFEGCASLEKITLPDGLTSIDASALRGCALTELHLPKEFGCMGSNPFANCRQLKSITVAKDGKCTAEDGVLYNQDKTELLCYPAAKEGDSFEIPETVASIAMYAFLNNNGLTGFTVAQENKTFTEKDGMVFQKEEDASEPKYLVLCPLGKKDIVVPEGTTDIDGFAFTTCDDTWVVPEESHVKFGKVTFPRSVERFAPDMLRSQDMESVVVIKDTPVASAARKSDVPYCEYQELEAEGSEPNTAALTGYTLGGAELQIPTEVNGMSVTEIGMEAFLGREDLQSVQIPEGVTAVGVSAFSGCTGLTEVTLPESLGILENRAFESCSKLAEVTLPEGVVLQENPFGKCGSLTSIVLAGQNPGYVFEEGMLYNKDKTRLVCCVGGKEGTASLAASVQEFAYGAFEGCGNLEKVRIPAEITELPSGLFDGCEVTLIVTKGSYAETYAKDSKIPYEYEGDPVGPEEPGTSEFQYQPIEAGGVEVTGYTGTAADLEIPAELDGKQVVRIHARAFQGKEFIKTVKVPQGVAGIGAEAFQNCVNLTEAVLPGSVVLEGNPFAGCRSLTDLVLEGEEPNYILEGGILLNKDKTALICCVGSTAGRVEIPDTITDIVPAAFQGCAKLTHVHIPAQVTSLPKGLFSGCTATLIVAKGSEAEVYAKKYQIPYIYEDGTEPDKPQETQDFQYVAVEGSAQDIEVTGYKGSRTEVTIPSELDGKKVVSIGEAAFADNYKLKKVTLPAGVTAIGEGAFQNCLSLTEATIGQGGAPAGRSAAACTVGAEAFQNCIRLARVTLPDGVVCIGRQAFQGCVALTGIALPQSLASLEAEAFSGCERLSQVAIPQGVTRIEDQVFQGCKELTSVALPESLTTIGKYAFVDCTNLAAVSVPEKVSSIGYGAFGGCSRNLDLGVVPGSYAKAYADENGIKSHYTKACIHRYTMKETRKPTCTAEGERRYTCSVCEESYTEAIPALKHQYGTVVNKATAQKDGSIVKTCSLCGDTLTTKIESVKDVALSKTEYTYNGKKQKPSVTVTDKSGRRLEAGKDYSVSYPSGMKNVGIYTITIRLAGNYSGTVTRSFTVFPKGTTLSKVTAQKKAFTAKWKKQTAQVTGYEIQYSTSSKFPSKSTSTKMVEKNKTVSLNVTKLKAKKKYYVRIRTYKNAKVNGKTTRFCSVWSKTKRVTTKKK